jgi:hypothetical protein
LATSLVEYADREVARLNIKRNRLIARALADIKAAEDERLAAEG